MTIKEIAEVANVSIGTVDRVLHNRNGVNNKTKKRVLQIVKSSGYQTNSFARDLKLKKHYRFVVVIPKLHSESDYWNLVKGGIDRAIKEMPSFLITVEYSLFDRFVNNSFYSCLHKVIESNPNGIVLAPPSKTEMENFRFPENTPPLCLIDSFAPSVNPLFTIAQDPYKGGIVSAKVMKLICPTSGLFVCLQVHPTAYNSMERSRGFRDGMTTNLPQNRLINWRLSTEESLDNLFKTYNDIKGIFTTSSATNIVGDYLKKNGLKDKITLVGYDLVDQNKKGLIDGSIDCIISQRPGYQGYTALNQLYNHIVLGKTIDKVQDIPIDIYFKENLSSSID